MKKILSLFLTACLAVTFACIFSACSDNGKAPESITLAEDACVLSGAGKTYDISSIVEISPDGASDNLVYTSSDTGVVEVSESGVATAKAFGVATVTVSSALDKNVKASIDVAVIDYFGNFSGEKYVDAMKCTVSISIVLKNDGAFEFCRGPMTVGGETNDAMEDEGEYSFSGATISFKGNNIGEFSASLSLQGGIAVLNGKFPTGGPSLELTLTQA